MQRFLKDSDSVALVWSLGIWIFNKYGRFSYRRVHGQKAFEKLCSRVGSTGWGWRPAATLAPCCQHWRWQPMEKAYWDGTGGVCPGGWSMCLWAGEGTGGGKWKGSPSAEIHFPCVGFLWEVSGSNGQATHFFLGFTSVHAAYPSSASNCFL